MLLSNAPRESGLLYYRATEYMTRNVAFIGSEIPAYDPQIVGLLGGGKNFKSQVRATIWIAKT